MNSQLMKHKPADSTKEEFEKVWNNSDYALEPLKNLLQELITKNNLIKPDDFDSANHYAKLSFQAGENKAYAYILSLLPSNGTI